MSDVWAVIMSNVVEVPRAIFVLWIFLTLYLVIHIAFYRLLGRTRPGNLTPSHPLPPAGYDWDTMRQKYESMEEGGIYPFDEKTVSFIRFIESVARVGERIVEERMKKRLTNLNDLAEICKIHERLDSLEHTAQSTLEQVGANNNGVTEAHKKADNLEAKFDNLDQQHQRLSGLLGNESAAESKKFTEIDKEFEVIKKDLITNHSFTNSVYNCLNERSDNTTKWVKETKDKFKIIDEFIESMESRMGPWFFNDSLSAVLGSMNERFTTLERRGETMSQFQKRLDDFAGSLETKIDAIEGRLDSMENSSLPFTDKKSTEIEEEFTRFGRSINSINDTLISVDKRISDLKHILQAHLTGHEWFRHGDEPYTWPKPSIIPSKDTAPPYVHPYGTWCSAQEENRREEEKGE